MTQLPYGLKTTGRGKAYEMMSCFVGLTEYARATGDQSLLGKVTEARDHIADFYREVNGCMSEREWFPNAENISEHSELKNCVAFTWIQLNLRLFELTGDIRCIDYAEENPEETEPASEAPLTCCHTNGQRALGLVPQYIYTQSGNDIFINFFIDSSKTLMVDGSPVTLTLQTDFPKSENIRLTVESKQPVDLYVRIPAWTDHAEISGKTCLPRQYEMLSSSNRSVFDIHIRQPLRLLTPGFVNRGKFAVARGPILYAVDSCPEGWDFDDIALSLSSKQPLSALVPFEENGWTAFRAKAYRTEHHISQLNWQNIPQSLPQAGVVLRPFFFAGLGKNLSYAQHTEAEPTPYDLSEPLTEFRVLFPVFFI